jgi:hypothetical protein
VSRGHARRDLTACQKTPLSAGASAGWAPEGAASIARQAAYASRLLWARRFTCLPSIVANQPRPLRSQGTGLPRAISGYLPGHRGNGSRAGRTLGVRPRRLLPTRSPLLSTHTSSRELCQICASGPLWRSEAFERLIVNRYRTTPKENRADRIRTCDLLTPSQARYQPAPRPDCRGDWPPHGGGLDPSLPIVVDRQRRRKRGFFPLRRDSRG